MARRRSAFASLSALRSTASSWGLAVVSSASGALHPGQRLAKPGLSGLSSNSSEQTTQVLIGKAITPHDNAGQMRCVPTKRALSHWLRRRGILVLFSGFLERCVRLRIVGSHPFRDEAAKWLGHPAIGTENKVSNRGLSRSEGGSGGLMGV